MRLPRRFVGEMIAHAIEDDPNECCGIIAGVDGRATKLYRARNAAESPYRYEVGAKELKKIYDDIERNGWQVFLIYHSHTGTKAYPSPTDVQLGAWQEAYYIIVSLQRMASPVVRAFRIVDEKITRQRIRIVSDDEGLEIERLDEGGP